MVGHICGVGCYDRYGVKKCTHTPSLDTPPDEQAPVLPQAITKKCLKLMDDIILENRRLIDHHKALRSNQENAAHNRKYMLEYELAAQGELGLIHDTIVKLEDYKAQLIKELSTTPQEAPSLCEELGRVV